MMIRVVAGEFGGRTIDAPDGKTTHPMSERARNALFNSLGPEVAESEWLDAFAGSGAVGFEALSRGARHVKFVERDRIAQKIISNNILKLAVGKRADLVRTTVSNWLETRTSDEMYDVVFADPPYHDVQLPILKRLGELVKPDGLLIVSLPEHMESPPFEGFKLESRKAYSGASLHLFRK